MEEGALNRRRAGALLAAAAIGAEVIAPAPLAALDVGVAVAFAAGAALVARVAPRIADLALAVAATWVLGTIAGLDGVPAYIAGTAVLLHRAPLALLILTYPARRPRSSAARALALAALLAPFAGPAAPVLTAVVAGLVALAAAIDAARVPGALRAQRAAAAAAGAAIAVAASVAAAELGSATQLLAAYDIVLRATAGGLLGPLAGGRWSAAATTGIVIELGATPAGAPVTGRLAEVLGDPGLELRLRDPGGSWTDEAGRPAPEHTLTRAHRAVTRQQLADGTEVALLHDPVAILDPIAAASAVAVAATAVDNARRDRAVQARIEELRRLRRGLLDAADEERRQLELELRSGPLRHTRELEERLRDVPGEHAATLRRELVLVRRELIELAHGLHPGALLEHGLIGALTQAAARSPLEVTVDARLDGRAPGAR
jgi:hypothetical protein